MTVKYKKYKNEKKRFYLRNILLLILLSKLWNNIWNKIWILYTKMTNS